MPTLQSFTLLEFLVIVMVGLLTGYIAPAEQLGKSAVQIAREQIDPLRQALDHYGVGALERLVKSKQAPA